MPLAIISYVSPSCIGIPGAEDRLPELVRTLLNPEDGPATFPGELSYQVNRPIAQTPSCLVSVRIEQFQNEDEPDWELVPQLPVLLAKEMPNHVSWRALPDHQGRVALESSAYVEIIVQSVRFGLQRYTASIFSPAAAVMI
jgi:hypothetical protein